MPCVVLWITSLIFWQPYWNNIWLILLISTCQ
jgi:hypothetical protein